MYKPSRLSFTITVDSPEEVNKTILGLMAEHKDYYPSSCYVNPYPEGKWKVNTHFTQIDLAKNESSEFGL